MSHDQQKLFKYIRVKHTDSFSVNANISKKKNEMTIVDILKDNLADQNKNVQPAWYRCLLKKRKPEIDDDPEKYDEDQIDDIDIKVNTYMAGERRAIENWNKIKFRLLIISKFSSY